MAGHKPFALDSYRLLGNSGLRVSPLCLGTMTFGTKWGWGADREESRRQFDLYTERGGNFIDTANGYTDGESEEFVGELIARDRERFVVATKFSFGTNRTLKDPNRGGNHRKNMVQALENSLRRLKTDYIDLYWLHVWEYRAPVEEVLRAVDDLVKAGKILYFGFSDTPAWKVAQANTLARAMGWTPAIALQIEYSLIERTVERELTPMARELGLGVTPWGAIGGGVLTGKYLDNPAGESNRGAMNQMRLTKRNQRIAAEVVRTANKLARTPAQVALNWLMQQPGVTSPILGARTARQLEDLLGTADFLLERRYVERLNKLSRIELGFPQSWAYNENVQSFIACDTEIEQHLP
ncbi:aldo/keto reductase [bacterium]|nr:aldo/keto reductase [bacterium]